MFQLSSIDDALNEIKVATTKIIFCSLLSANSLLLKFCWQAKFVMGHGTLKNAY